MYVKGTHVRIFPLTCYREVNEHFSKSKHRYRICKKPTNIAKAVISPIYDVLRSNIMLFLENGLSRIIDRTARS